MNPCALTRTQNICDAIRAISYNIISVSLFNRTDTHTHTHMHAFSFSISMVRNGYKNKCLFIVLASINPFCTRWCGVSFVFSMGFLLFFFTEIASEKNPHREDWRRRWHGSRDLELMNPFRYHRTVRTDLIIWWCILIELSTNWNE